VNPTIAKSLVGSILSSSLVRFVVQPAENAEPIPDGPLYTCTVRALPSALPGAYSISNKNLSGYSPENVPLFVVGEGGSIMVVLVLPTPIPTATPVPSETPTNTPPPTETAAAMPTDTPSPSPTPLCTGDCTGNSEVTVGELITMVNIALGNAPLSACTAGDADGSGDVTINEIIAAVNHALNGCSG
jgi:hypothetical protein